MLKIAKIMTIGSVAAAIAVGSAPADAGANAARMISAKNFSFSAISHKLIANWEMLANLPFGE